MERASSTIDEGKTKPRHMFSGYSTIPGVHKGGNNGNTCCNLVISYNAAHTIAQLRSVTNCSVTGLLTVQLYTVIKFRWGWCRGCLLYVTLSRYGSSAAPHWPHAYTANSTIVSVPFAVYQCGRYGVQEVRFRRPALPRVLKADQGGGSP